MAKPLRQADPRVDAYIKKAQPFARPILAHLQASYGDAQHTWLYSIRSVGRSRARKSG